MTRALEPIEAAVLKDVFLQKGLLGEDDSFADITVSERRFTGVGFFTDINPSEALRIGALDNNERWLNTQATLNTNLVVGFLVYIDNGQITTIEGFTYGDDKWPDTIFEFTIEHLAGAPAPEKD